MGSLSRREFLQLSGMTAALSALAACRPPADGPAPGRLQSHDRLRTPDAASPDDEPGLALRKVTFGPRPEEIERARTLGWAAFIDEQLHPEDIADEVAEQHLSGLETLDLPAEELFALGRDGQPAGELIQAALIRAVSSRRQLYELMVDFWTDHFNIYLRDGPLVYLKPVDDREVIRRHALGHFPELLGASARSPAMLVYLDNARSTGDRPNENYARELLELHTLGVDGGYSQQDVEMVARILTGWTVSGPRSARPGEFFFNERGHDPGEKTALGQVFPAGGGLGQGEQLLELIALHPATAHHISFKLVRRFVADEPPQGLVERAAARFLETHGDIRSVLRTILLSEEFARATGAKVKRPVEFVASALRQTDAGLAPDRRMLAFLTQMGQVPFLWPAPDGYPDLAAWWSTTNGLMTRWNFALALAFDRLEGMRVDWPALAGNPDDIRDGLDPLSDRLLGRPLYPDETGILTNFLRTLPPGAAFDWQAAGALLLATPAFSLR